MVLDALDRLSRGASRPSSPGGRLGGRPAGMFRLTHTQRNTTQHTYTLHTKERDSIFFGTVCMCEGRWVWGEGGLAKLGIIRQKLADWLAGSVGS